MRGHYAAHSVAVAPNSAKAGALLWVIWKVVDQRLKVGGDILAIWKPEVIPQDVQHVDCDVVANVRRSLNRRQLGE